KIPQKKSVALLVLLSIITIGIYPAIWYIKRVTELNNLNTTKKLGKTVPIILLILEIISILVFIALLAIIPLLFLIPSLAIILAGTITYVSWGIYILAAILFLIAAFNFRSLINEVLSRKGTNRKISILFTIFFNYLYLQYEINRTIDDREYAPRTGPGIWFVIYLLIILYYLYVLIIPLFTNS
ncbi:MAG: hypothetical protein AABY15_08750, partial [Nanoarchaeota archaeon]